MKRLTAIILAFFIAILLPFTASAAPSDDFETHLTSLENHVQSGQLAQSLQAAQSGQPDDWAAIALARDGALNQENQAAYLGKLRSETNLSGTALEKVIIALKALKQDPTDFNGRNLISELGRDTSVNTPSADIYALIAFNKYEDRLPAGAVNTPASLIQKILSQADQDGGWGYAGPPADVDTTGAALAALAPYQNQADVKEAINKAVEYLASIELPDGGFSNYGENSDSTAEAVIGLTSVGIDPTSGQFDKGGKNPLNNLYTFQSGDGYVWQKGDAEDPYTNEEVLEAFVAYKVFLSGGKLFVFPVAASSAPAVKTPAPVKTQPMSQSSLGKKTSSKKSVVKIIPKTSHPAANQKTLPIQKIPSAQHTTSTVLVSTAASHPAAEKTKNSPVSKTKVSNNRPKTHKSVKKHKTTQQAQAAGSKKDHLQTKAAQSTVVNPIILISGTIVTALGASALIFRKAIWRRRA